MTQPGLADEILFTVDKATANEVKRSGLANLDFTNVLRPSVTQGLPSVQAWARR